MPATGFDDPRLAARPPGGNLFYTRDAAVASTIGPNPPDHVGEPGHAQLRDVNPPPLMFGTPANVQQTKAGAETIVSPANSGVGSGHFSEVLNFHGSPAPWILLGILLVAGIVHLEAGAKLKGSL